MAKQISANKVVASCFLIGYIPFAPGTFASAAILPVFIFLGGYSYIYIASALIITAAGIWFSGRTEKEEGCKDPQTVVIDECAGQLITFLFMPYDVLTVFFGFVLFRLFDIFKPFFIRQTQKLPGGFGIMADDICCGICANIILRIIKEVIK